jgi:hypothetical protein
MQSQAVEHDRYSGLAWTSPHPCQASPGEQDDAEGDVGDVGDALEEKGFSVVCTEALEAMGLTPHPDPIAETATLASVKPPHESYRVALPTEVLISEHCSVQLSVTAVSAASTRD